MNDRRIGDLARFADLQLESRDMDPAYHVLRALQGDLGTEQALWHSVLYVAYYNVASSHVAFVNAPEAGDNIQGALAKLPTGVERRGLRGGYNLTRHIESWSAILETYGTLSAFFNEAMTKDPRESWRRLQRLLRQPYGNGRWAAYKTGEVLMKVNGYALEPTDMGNDFSSGPRQGLALFFDVVKGNGPDAIRELDRQAELLQDILRLDYGCTLPIEELETALCDFHALTDGRYYVGHDIDGMQEQIQSASADWRKGGELMEEVWMAREKALPRAYLGELTGRAGVDRRRLFAYSTTGEILSRGDAVSLEISR